MPTKIEISHKTIVFTVFFLALLWLLVQIKDIIFLVFIAFILMSALKPVVEFLEKHKIRRTLGILLIYLLIFVAVTLAGSSFIPPLVFQSVTLAKFIPNYLKDVLPFIQVDFQSISAQIAPISENILKVTLGVFSNVIAIFTIFVICFYLLLERKYLKKHLSQFMGEKGAKVVIEVIKKVEERLGSWVRGQLALMFLIGFSTYIGLFILNLPFILPLSILAGVLEIIPIIGPIVSAIPAVIVALTISPFLGLVTALLYLIIQQAESNLVVPAVMRKTVGLPPLVTIIALAVGGKVAGVIGALLSVPVVVTIETIVSEYFKQTESE